MTRPPEGLYICRCWAKSGQGRQIFLIHVVTSVLKTDAREVGNTSEIPSRTQQIMGRYKTPEPTF